MNIRNFFLLFTFGIILTCCKSAKEFAMEGKYDKAFDKALNALKKNPNDAESFEILMLSFDNANEKNLNRINQLQTNIAANRWIEIAELYNLLQIRHDKMRQIIPFFPASIRSSIKTQDYNILLTNAKVKAADFYFKGGLALLNMESKSKAREAIKYFKQASRYNPSDQEILRMVDEATFLGTNHVLYVVNNYTPLSLPYDFLSRMTRLPNDPYLHLSWVEYYIQPEAGFKYDYIIELNFESINIVPERINTKSTVHNTTIDDGWEYETDRRGNTVKDANGNPVRQKKVRQLMCEVLETTLTKSIFINVRLNYTHAKTNQLLKSIPMTIEETFLYHYVTFKGDRNAVDNKVLSKLPKNDRPVSFPSATDLIQMSREKMAERVLVMLRNNNKIIRNSD